MRKRSWIGRIPVIFQRLSSGQKEELDRSEVAELFKIGRSQALDLMKIAGADITNGLDAKVKRSDLLLYLNQSPDTKHFAEGYAKEQQAAEERRLRSTELGVTPWEFAARRLTTRWDDLTDVSLEPGLLRITFSTRQDLIRNLMLVSRAMASQPEEFDRLCGDVHSDVQTTPHGDQRLYHRKRPCRIDSKGYARGEREDSGTMNEIRLTAAQFDALPEYSCSLPTATRTTIGRRWRKSSRSHTPGLPDRVRWWMGEYTRELPVPTCCRYHRCIVRVVDSEPCHAVQTREGVVYDPANPDAWPEPPRCQVEIRWSRIICPERIHQAIQKSHQQPLEVHLL